MPKLGSDEHLRYRYWLHFAEASAMPPLLLKLAFDKVTTSPMPFFVRPIAKVVSAKVLGMVVEPNLKRQFDFMEAGHGRNCSVQPLKIATRSTSSVTLSSFMLLSMCSRCSSISRSARAGSRLAIASMICECSSARQLVAVGAS